mmetsp:Transcript_4606/g.13123  ORF Transcript_4606/g.13123 Transcript_4606/m.13123 type:complete len:228 (-) Transcript_4606:834-1517(-)
MRGARHQPGWHPGGLRLRRQRPQGRVLLPGRRRPLHPALRAHGPRAARAQRDPERRLQAPLQPGELLLRQGGRRRGQQLGGGPPPGRGAPRPAAGDDRPRGGQLGQPRGLRVLPQHRRRHGLGHGLLPARAAQRPLPQEAHPDVQRLPELDLGLAERRRRAALQLHPHNEAPRAQRRRRRRARQHRPEPHRCGPPAHPQPHRGPAQLARLHRHGRHDHDAALPRLHE